MRNIGVLTTSRAEYGILRPVLAAITADPDLTLQLFVGGSHLSPEFGYTLAQIEFPILEKVECLLSGDTPECIAKNMGLTLMGFSQVFSHVDLDLLFITGDRYEAAAVALAALPFKIPIVHLGGGAVSLGAFDESLRHVITKLSHFHLCYAAEEARRVIQMGENPEHVFITGNPALDCLEESSGEYIVEGALVVIFHPVTLEYEHTDEYFGNLVQALSTCKRPIVFIQSNADTYNHKILQRMKEFHNACFYPSLLPCQYYDLLRHATVLIGNSSSGIMEAPSFELPVVNIGTRQGGRLRGKNVIDVGYSPQEIIKGIYQATQPEFRESLRGTANPYGDGKSAPRIIKLLKDLPLEGILEKRFYGI
jgi:UDP-N-acetylglucosamine 2-epimerase (non-hydrolysing)